MGAELVFRFELAEGVSPLDVENRLRAIAAVNEWSFVAKRRKYHGIAASLWGRILTDPDDFEDAIAERDAGVAEVRTIAIPEGMANIILYPSVYSPQVLTALERTGQPYFPYSGEVVDYEIFWSEHAPPFCVSLDLAGGATANVHEPRKGEPIDFYISETNDYVVNNGHGTAADYARAVRLAQALIDLGLTELYDSTDYADNHDMSALMAAYATDYAVRRELTRIFNEGDYPGSDPI